MMRMRTRTTTTTMTTGTRGMESREKLAAVVPFREGSSSGGGFVGPVPKERGLCNFFDEKRVKIKEEVFQKKGRNYLRLAKYELKSIFRCHDLLFK